ncbi:RsmB/NOP family class I SAM-dependent RNA methyltransferase [Puniceibacterium sediminis]|uniref:16S rRNA (Cytosine967-C5)-methyltransferase n=1 Tax=Puniceibacterium sediminis TaxID=1608407 RepID=A0A238Z8L8_9RHOB|nr:RsmB/NOP family class I SAM-dependent RNA methyltransferase [Puniceibacterium sediminis]SNR79193.1 16S rRNA (cytosine967-C5)-methyltransferase [Puniceibacterium sediminis]
MSTRPLSARHAAVDLLDQILGQERLMSELMGGNAWAAMTPGDRAAAQRLANDVLRGMERADRVLKPFLKKAPPLRVMNVLRLATVELCSGGAAHGVVNEAVNIVARGGRTAGMKGLVNAVLRKVVARGPAEWDKLRVPRMPGWLRDPLVEAWGRDAVMAMEAVQFAGAPLDLTAKGDAAAVADAVGGVLLPTGSVRVADAGQVSLMPGFEAGDWWVQDAAAALPVRMLGDVAGLTVLDMCAAPGGKTLQLAAAGAKVTALDLSEARMARLAENLARTGLEAELLVGDAMEIDGSYDAILLDAPCSATGTIRRHPDLPHAKSGDGIDELITLQGQMLEHALSLLKPGGRLVFCTCSLLPDEGECQIEAALERGGVAVLPVDLPGISQNWVSLEGGLRLRPDYWAEIGGMDGFYMAALRKTA